MISALIALCSALGQLSGTTTKADPYLTFFQVAREFGRMTEEVNAEDGISEKNRYGIGKTLNRLRGATPEMAFKIGEVVEEKIEAADAEESVWGESTGHRADSLYATYILFLGRLSQQTDFAGVLDEQALSAQLRGVFDRSPFTPENQLNLVRLNHPAAMFGMYHLGRFFKDGGGIQ